MGANAEERWDDEYAHPHAQFPSTDEVDHAHSARSRRKKRGPQTAPAQTPQAKSRRQSLGHDAAFHRHGDEERVITERNQPNAAVDDDDSFIAKTVTPNDVDEQAIKEKLRDFWNLRENPISKPRIKVEGLAGHHHDLATKAKELQTGTFQGLFVDATAAENALMELGNLYRKPLRDVTVPAEDATFPTTADEMTAVVKKVFDAIMDWSYILEWKAAVSRNDKLRIMKRLTSAGGGTDHGLDVGPEGLRPPVEELLAILPSVKLQQQRILGQVPSDLIIELVSWGVVHSKQLVKSLLTAGDGWKLRIVNCPRKEFRAKGNNRRVNAAKERQWHRMSTARSDARE
ncbi:hypothetical protein RJ55_01243 [Drechmeria coniospora]|nr:hypothetical protein RJ55_01243 [Drechmeria coniospora]